MVFSCTRLTLLPLCYLLAVSYAEKYVVEKGRRCTDINGDKLDNGNKLVKPKRWTGKNLTSKTIKERCKALCDRKMMCKGFAVKKWLEGKKIIADCWVYNIEITSGKAAYGYRLLKEEKNKSDKKAKSNKDKDKDKNDKNDKNDKKDKEVEEEEEEEEEEEKEDEEKKDKKNAVTKKVFFCGTKIVVTPSPTSSPTGSLSPTTSSPPTTPHGIVYNIDENSMCKEKKGKRKAKKSKNVLSLAACVNKCGFAANCKAFDYNGKNKVCKMYNYHIEQVKQMPENKYSSCGRLPVPTRAPVAPTPAPVTPPTNTPVKQQGSTCELQVVHAHPITKVDNAPYYGEHADLLEISRTAGSWCSYYSDLDWCTYTNSEGENYYGAWVNNLEKYYLDAYLLEHQQLSTETFKVQHAAEQMTIINSYHLFGNEEYYPNYDTWQDHMMAPVVKIYNLSNDAQTLVGSYQHPTDTEIPDLKKDLDGLWSANELYEGNMKIVISCSKFCWCTEESFSTSKGDGFEDYYYRDGEQPGDAQRIVGNSDSQAFRKGKPRKRQNENR